MDEAMDSPPKFPGHLEEQGTRDESGPTQLLTHFHLFKDLPPELRQRIYQACLPHRVFKLCYVGWNSMRNDLHAQFAKKPAYLPLISFVSKEAYYVSKLFLREYETFLVEIMKSHGSIQAFTRSTTRIRFNLDLDTLVINFFGTTADETREDDVSYNGPFALPLNPKANLVLDMARLVGPRWGIPKSDMKWLTARPHCDILAQRSHCTAILARTAFFAKESEIRASGLFGLFGEERTVFVDINDTAKIDQFESYIRQLDPESTKYQCRCSYFPEDLYGGFFPEDSDGGMDCWEGTGRYASEGRAFFDSKRTHGIEHAATPPSVHSVAGLHSVAEQDAASALLLIQQSWLEANHCSEPAHNPLVPWTGDAWWRKWDDDHGVVKHWLSKLPTFSFVVMFQVTEIRDTAVEHFANPS